MAPVSTPRLVSPLGVRSLVLLPTVSYGAIFSAGFSPLVLDGIPDCGFMGALPGY
jgi:hypothetical protein